MRSNGFESLTGSARLESGTASRNSRTNNFDLILKRFVSSASEIIAGRNVKLLPDPRTQRKISGDVAASRASLDVVIDDGVAGIRSRAKGMPYSLLEMLNVPTNASGLVRV